MRGISPGCCACAPSGKAAAAPLQPIDILLGIEESVDMVDPQARELAFGEPAEQLTVRRLEQLAQLHADPGQLVDVEEAPVIDLVG